jgi:hypothetical protein
VVCLAPRAPGDSVRPRRLSGMVARPLNFTVKGAMRRALPLLVLLAASTPISADIYKLAVPTDQGIQFYWWPIVPSIDGWTHDEGASRAHGVNALVPAGQTFSGAPAIIYARAMYKPRIPEVKSLGQLITDDIATFKQDFPGVAVDKLSAIRDGDGRSHPYYSFNPKGNGSWELVAYGEEGDFYLIFTLSGQSKAARDAARSAFEKLVSRYREHL